MLYNLIRFLFQLGAMSLNVIIKHKKRSIVDCILIKLYVIIH